MFLLNGRTSLLYVYLLQSGKIQKERIKKLEVFRENNGHRIEFTGQYKAYRLMLLCHYYGCPFVLALWIKIKYDIYYSEARFSFIFF